MSDPSALNGFIHATRAYQSSMVAKPTVKHHVQPDEPPYTPSPAPDAEALARSLAPAVSRLIGREIRERGVYP